MKKRLFFISLVMAAVLFLICQAEAAPFLICNPQTGVEGYILDIDGNVTTEPAYDLGDDTVMLHKDLADLPAGEHACTLKADYGVWGVSAESTPFLFTKPSMESPSVLELTAE
jgi:hypothetical protein